MSQNYGDLDGPNLILKHEEQIPTIGEHAAILGHRTAEGFVKLGGAIAHNLTLLFQLTPENHRHA